MAFENTYNILQEFADSAEVLYREKLIDSDAIADGSLINSVKANITVRNTNYTVYLSLLDYWKYIEEGRKPNSKFPPPNEILKWIQSKPIIPRPDQNGKLPTEKQLSFLIGRKIAKEGIKAKPLLTETVESVYNEFIDKIVEAFAEDVQESAFEIITSQINQSSLKFIKTN